MGYDADVVTVKTKGIGQGQCPRCNAVSDLVAYKARSDSDAMSVVLRCPKCRFKNVVGFTTETSMKISKRRQKLVELLETAETPEQREPILEELQQMDHFEKSRGMWT